MKTISYEELEKTAKQVMAKAYLRGEMTETKRLRRAERDLQKSAILSHLASARIRRNPIRRNEDNTLTIPYLEINISKKEIL